MALNTTAFMKVKVKIVVQTSCPDQTDITLPTLSCHNRTKTMSK